METPTFLSIDEAAERLSCSVLDLKELLLAGSIPFMPGRPVLIAENALASYIRSSSVRSRSELTHEQRLEEEYSELKSIFGEVMRQNGDTLRATPLYHKLMEPFKDLPSLREISRQTRIAFVLADQRRADPKLQKQKERQASEAAKRRTTAEKRAKAVKERQAKKAAQPKTSS